MKKNLRKIHLDGEEWHYITGNGQATIFAPNSKVPMKLDGKDWHNVEYDANHAKTDGYSYCVTPAVIKQYIIDKLVPKRLKDGIG